MVELLNTLYVQTQGVTLHLEGDTVRVSQKRETITRVPLLRLQGIVVFGNVMVTPLLRYQRAQDGRLLAWFSYHGRFRGRLHGPTSGNVLLRRAQHDALTDAGQTQHIARQVVAAKIQNARHALLRAAREADGAEDAAHLAVVLRRLPSLNDLNDLRGAEGEAARTYFTVFSRMVRVDRAHFALDGRTPRPPRDPMNALLSFLYALLCAQCEAALEGVGLDPQVGYLHALRPGRPALALDLMEELRPVLADRGTLTLVNRRQLQARHFEGEHAIRLTDEGRRILLNAYEERKAAEVSHTLLRQKLPLGLVPHIQARLMARYLRGDIATYPPFLYR